MPHGHQNVRIGVDLSKSDGESIIICTLNRCILVSIFGRCQPYVGWHKENLPSLVMAFRVASRVNVMVAILSLGEISTTTLLMVD